MLAPDPRQTSPPSPREMKKLMEMKKAAEQAKLGKEAQAIDAATPTPVAPAAEGAGPSLTIDKAAVVARSPPKGSAAVVKKQAIDPLAGAYWSLALT